jgi:membrane protease YdiL (CAAX protease family)
MIAGMLTRGELPETHDQTAETPTSAPLLSPSSEPYPGFWQAVGLLILYSVFIQLVIGPFWIADKLRHTSLAKHPAVLAVAIFVAGWLVVRLVCRRLKMSIRELVAVAPIRRDVLLPMGAAVIGTVLLEVPCIFWIVRRFPGLVPSEPFDLGRSVWGVILLASIVAPLIEESIFRGIFLRGFVARYGTARGVALGAALFAAMHFYPVKLPGTMLIGVLFGWWFVELHSIWPGVFGHALNNSIAVLGLLSDPAAAQGAVPPFTWAEPVAATIGALMLACGVVVLRRKFQGPPPRKAGTTAAE